jgi:hypothetical protein
LRSPGTDALGDIDDVYESDSCVVLASKLICRSHSDMYGLVSREIDEKTMKTIHGTVLLVGNPT